MPKAIENIRESILENGKKMLLEGSYADFNIRSLAKKCNIGLGTLYNYYESKEALAHHIFKNDWEKTLQLAEDVRHMQIPLKEKLRQIYSSLENFISQYMSIFHEMAQGGQKSSHHNYYLEIYHKVKELLDEEQKTVGIDSKVGTDKLAYFIMSNVFNAIRHKHITFDEMYECIRI